MPIALQSPPSLLLGTQAPRVLTTAMLGAILAHRRPLPAAHAVSRWIREQVARGALRPMTRGLYLNQLAAPGPSAAEAAGFIRTGAIVSLQTVLGEAGVTNNLSDIVTSVLPQEPRHVPSVRPVRVAKVEFRFHALPARHMGEQAGAVEDRLDLAVQYPRATPEKAFLDWLYLGDSRCSSMDAPSLDLDLQHLNLQRLHRLARSMNLMHSLRVWLLRRKEWTAEAQSSEHPDPRI